MLSWEAEGTSLAPTSSVCEAEQHLCLSGAPSASYETSFVKDFHASVFSVCP